MALRFGRTPLIMACRAGDASAVDALLLSSTESSTVNTADAHGFTPLYHAAMFGHVRIIERLLLDGQCEREVDDVKGAGGSAGRADIGAADLGGLTPLHIACEKGRAGAAAALLAHGADAATVDSIGRTPRDWAEAKGHAACVALF